MVGGLKEDCVTQKTGVIFLEGSNSWRPCISARCLPPDTPRCDRVYVVAQASPMSTVDFYLQHREFPETVAFHELKV